VLLLTLSGWAASQSVFALSDGYYELGKHDIHAAFATGLLFAVVLEGLGRYGVPAGWRRLRRGRDRGTARAPVPALT